MKNEENDENEACDQKLRSSLRQVQTDEGTSPDTLDEDDLSVDIPE